MQEDEEKERKKLEAQTHRLPNIEPQKLVHLNRSLLPFLVRFGIPKFRSQHASATPKTRRNERKRSEKRGFLG